MHVLRLSTFLLLGIPVDAFLRFRRRCYYQGETTDDGTNRQPIPGTQQWQIQAGAHSQSSSSWLPFLAPRQAVTSSASHMLAASNGTSSSSSNQIPRHGDRGGRSVERQQVLIRGAFKLTTTTDVHCEYQTGDPGATLLLLAMLPPFIVPTFLLP